MTDLSAYRDLIARKAVSFDGEGLAEVPELHPEMFPLQRAVTEFALRTGRSGAFLDTGLGKTFCELEWGHQVVRATNRPVLMLAPLAVGHQHAAEAARFGIDARVARDRFAVREPRVYIANYERLDLFDTDAFGGVALDESSILKSFTGVTTRKLINAFAQTPFRLAATATPAPNDHTELGQHSAFLGVMPANEMLSRWFIADQTEMGRYRLKRPAIRPFWDWVASWARCVSKPSDLGFSDEGYDLPPLDVRQHLVEGDWMPDEDEGGPQLSLIRTVKASATSIHKEKRRTAERRADKVAEIVAADPDEPWIVWCDTDYEADALAARLPGFVEVRGSHRPEVKEERLVAFSSGQARGIITKPSIAGFGLNWQHCARMAFIGLSFSYEAFYQAVRRSWRFGQRRPVAAHVVCSDAEAAAWRIVSRKAGDHDGMKREMTSAMRRAARVARVLHDYDPQEEARLPAWIAA